jgi:hypothetical protein
MSLNCVHLRPGACSKLRPIGSQHHLLHNPTGKWGIHDRQPTSGVD